MPRKPRVHVPGGFYHVTLRGNHQERLFATGDDRDALDEIVTSALERCRAKIHAFCWMHNHLHAIAEISRTPLAKVMQRIAQQYSRYRHKALFLTGHLFERRYWDKLIQVDEYFKQLLRYIHRNPVEAALVHNPADYLWSSHRAYLGAESIPWLTTELGLSLFGNDLEAARAEYRRFVDAPPAEEEDGVGKGAGREKLKNAPKLLHPNEVADLLTPAPELRWNPPTLAELAEQVCAKYAVPIDELCSRSRRRSLSPARAELAARAVEGRVATLKAVAQFLGRDPSALSHLLRHHQVSALTASGVPDVKIEVAEHR